MSQFFESNIFFYIAFIAGLTNLSLMLLGAKSETITYWPPPQKKSWQFYSMWSLFILFSGSYIALVYLELSRRNDSLIFFLLGTALTATGLIFANYITYRLGAENASGLKKGLRTEGWYSVSRNPVYAATFIALAGVVLFLPIPEIFVLSFFWVLSYIIAVRLEEDWLEEQYGEEYILYKNRVPRFLGLKQS
jgi:protein-S-isoprenylcysteine O-methyltransferase Ste14